MSRAVNGKEPVRGEIAPKKISHIQFGLLSGNDMARVSEFQVSSRHPCCGVRPRRVRGAEEAGREPVRP
jgi:hypothetical protein